MNGFRAFLEMTDAINDPPVKLMPSLYDSGVYYKFEIDGNSYWLRFSKRSPVEVRVDPINHSVSVADVVFEVDLSGPNGNNLTRLNIGTRIYRRVVRGFKAVYEQFRPDAFMFFGYTNDQTMIYQKLHQQFLKPYYTQISGNIFLRNDLYQQYAREKGLQWQAIEKLSTSMNAYRNLIRDTRLSRQADRQFALDHRKRPTSPPPDPDWSHV